MKKYLIYLLTSFCFTNNFYPEDNSNVNYTQIFFKWPQIENTISYTLTLTPEIGNPLIINSESNSIINTEYLSWGMQYTWEICGNNEIDQIISCHEPKNLIINPLPLYYPNQLDVLLLSENDYYDGITILDFDSMRFSSALDKHGVPIWFIDRSLFGNFNSKILVTELLTSGNFTGIGIGSGYEFDINGNVFFETPSEYPVHHDFIRKDNTYFLINAVNELNPCPDDCPDNLPEDIFWQGDRFIQLDLEGELIWEWNTFDYIDLNEYNPRYLDRLSNSYPEEESMDWTHANSIFYNGDNIFVSIRNLSRIIKIDYSTKDIKWHIGDTEFMNEIYFDNQIEFSQQHSIKKLDNGNVLFFDNHTFLEPQISRCIEFQYDQDLNTAEVVWEYILPDSLFTGSRGECDRLDNGNTLINVGRTGNVYEVNVNDEIIWHLRMKNNDLDISSFRAERVDNLYPLAYSVIIQNLKGDYNNYYIQNTEDIIEFTLHNIGWEDQEFIFSIYNTQNEEIYNNLLTADAYSEANIQIDTSIITITNNEEYKLKISPTSKPDSYQEIYFYIEGILGDFNNDSIVNIIDIIIMVNSILANEYNALYDLNNDQLNNILDIIRLMNIILD